MPTKSENPTIIFNQNLTRSPVTKVFVIMLDIAAMEIKKQPKKERKSAVNVNYEELPCYTPFFVNNLPPTGLSLAGGNYAYICQQLGGNQNMTYFATMFDKSAGIPVYSAYVVTNVQAIKFETGIRKKLDQNWETESGKMIYTPLDCLL